MTWSLSLTPAFPLWLVATAAAVALVLALAGLWRRMPGSLLRLLALALILAGLLNPAIIAEDRQPLKSVVALVADRSASQGLGERAADTDVALSALQGRLKQIPGLDVRTIDAAAVDTGKGTALFGDLARVFSDVPPERIAGAILLTDGQIHDIPANPAALGFNAPVHGLITGHPQEFDRRIAWVSVPKFGLVKSTQTLSFRLEDQGASQSRTPAELVLRRDGQEIARRNLSPGETATLDVDIPHAGENIFEITVPVLPGELSPINNSEVAIVQGIRENLRVLLVSGEPHPGERTWRNLLKSDASVDLVHFTILRPPEKQDGTPINELSLIAFPTRELFDEKIGDFDLIIFDRYQKRGVLPLIYFDNISRYVAEGGALLMAAGPDPLNPDTVYDSPLVPILPVVPTGNVFEEPFKPVVSPTGKRHPVTRNLSGDDGATPAWSRWFRLIEADGERGDAVMTGAGNKPLLVLSHEGEGRVAMLLSDQVWLWARDFEGGGPYLELLRNLAHWLMKEPDLEEEALRLHGENGDLVIERQTLKDKVAPVTVTFPNAAKAVAANLQQVAPGLYRATLRAPELGLYKATDGTLTALAHVGPTNPREFQSLISTTAALDPLATATGGSVRRLRQAAGAPLTLPSLRMQDADSTVHAGTDWIGLKASSAYEVVGVRHIDLGLGLIGLGLLLGAVAATWWRESR